MEDIEWFLLSRLASQRQATSEGARLLVLDDPFSGLEAGEGVRLAGALQRIAGAVQIVLLTDAPALTEWAGDLVPDRATVIALA